MIDDEDAFAVAPNWTRLFDGGASADRHGARARMGSSMSDLRDLPKRLAVFFHENMLPSANGRYYATPALAEKLQAFLSADGFRVRVVVDDEGRFDVVAEVPGDDAPT